MFHLTDNKLREGMNSLAKTFLHMILLYCTWATIVLPLYIVQDLWKGQPFISKLAFESSKFSPSRKTLNSVLVSLLIDLCTLKSRFSSPTSPLKPCQDSFWDQCKPVHIISEKQQKGSLAQVSLDNLSGVLVWNTRSIIHIDSGIMVIT